MKANEGVCDRCEYIKEERLLLGAASYLREVLLDFEVRIGNGRDAPDKNTLWAVSRYVDQHPDYGQLINVYIKDFARLGNAYSALIKDAEFFTNAIKRMECKCDTHPSSAG